MKLLTIGSSSSSNIVLNSEFVSNHHAEILLLDSGEIILEDKNSTNGTFVGGKRITPNKEVTIQRGDYVKFADVELQWSRVPALENTSKYKSILSFFSGNDLIDIFYKIRFYKYFSRINLFKKQHFFSCEFCQTNII